MKYTFKRVGGIAGSIVAIAVLIGLVFSLNAYVAKAKDVRQLEIRLDQKIIQDRVDFLQERIWKLEDRYHRQIARMEPEVRNTYRRLKKELEDAKRKLAAVISKAMK